MIHRKIASPKKRTWVDTADTTDAYFDGRREGAEEAWKQMGWMLFLAMALAFALGTFGGYGWGYRNGQIDDATGIRHFHEARTFEDEHGGAVSGETTWIDDRQAEWERLP